MRRKLGRPRVDSEDVHVRLTRPALDTLDAWIAAQPEPRPSRPEAIRRILAEALGKTAGADVKSPALPPASDAFLRALGHRQENGEGADVRLRKSGK
jgi:Arc/MetJ-type ribon-helix-helix transcriptional regulator